MNAEAEANAEEAMPRREAEQNQKSRAQIRAAQRDEQREEQRRKGAEQTQGAKALRHKV